jgi:ATP-binding cassette subfamily B protein
MERAEKLGKVKIKLKTLWQGMQTVQRMEPKFLPIGITFAIFQSLSPFINIAMTARIIDELLGEKSLSRLCLYVVITIGLNLLIHLTTKGLEHLRNISSFRFSYLSRNELNRFILSTDYENVEKPDFHLKKQKIDESGNVYGRGIWNIARHLEAFIAGLFTVGFSVAMAFPLFIRSGFKDIHSIFASPWLSVVLFVLVIISSVYSVLSNAKCSKELFRMMDGVMPVNRMFFYYIGLMTDVRFGKDVRIYHQTGAVQA